MAEPRQMRRNGWHVVREGDRTVLARHWPPRFDVAAESRFPPARPDRLARQIRQDLWRELQGLRGFSPVIQIDADDTGLTVTAGGRLEAAAAPREQARIRIAALLECPRHRARWLTWARERSA